MPLSISYEKILLFYYLLYYFLLTGAINNYSVFSNRAVVESHPNTEAELLPPVVVTLASNETDFMTR